MKKIICIVIALMLCVGIYSIAGASEKEPVNKFLEEAKTKNIQVLEKDETGKFVVKTVNLYEKELQRRSQPANPQKAQLLSSKGIAKAKNKEAYTVGDAENYALSQPVSEYVKQHIKSSYGKTEQELAGWTALDAENYLYEQIKDIIQAEEPNYTSEVLEHINSLDITEDQLHTLRNLGYTTEEIAQLTQEQVNIIFQDLTGGE